MKIVRLKMDEFPNFEKILAKNWEKKSEEIMVKLRADEKARELRHQEEQERKRLIEMEKQFRKLYIERFVQSCIDIIYDIVPTQIVLSLTPDDIYKRVKYYNEVDFEKFFTPDDVKNILDGLVKNGLLKCVYGQKDSYVPRRLSDNE